MLFLPMHRSINALKVYIVWYLRLHLLSSKCDKRFFLVCSFTRDVCYYSGEPRLCKSGVD